ncbi:MAG: Bax inhibitor-1/YccA family protein [Bacteroidales bacterium]|nr:Bax inhibitor-1/YccA family protein [Bacteroidales bacterium]
MYEKNYNCYETASYGSRSVSFPAVMRNVYMWMCFALAMTGLTAAAVATQPQILQAIFTNQILFWGLFIGEFALVIFFSARIMSMSLTTAGLVFAAYSILNGVTMSFIFLAYTMESIATTFFITAGTFGAMSLIGYTTKRDLSTMGRILFMALIGVIIATVVNIFVGSSALQFGISILGVLIFTGLTAYDTQKIKMMVEMYGDQPNEGVMKLALLGSLSLYLDFINLFLYLLRFFGNSRD